MSWSQACKKNSVIKHSCLFSFKLETHNGLFFEFLMVLAWWWGFLGFLHDLSSLSYSWQLRYRHFLIKNHWSTQLVDGSRNLAFLFLHHGHEIPCIRFANFVCDRFIELCIEFGQVVALDSPIISDLSARVNYILYRYLIVYRQIDCKMKDTHSFWCRLIDCVTS